MVFKLFAWNVWIKSKFSMTQSKTQKILMKLVNHWHFYTLHTSNDNLKISQLIGLLNNPPHSSCSVLNTGSHLSRFKQNLKCHLFLNRTTYCTVTRWTIWNKTSTHLIFDVTVVLRFLIRSSDYSGSQCFEWGSRNRVWVGEMCSLLL